MKLNVACNLPFAGACHFRGAGVRMSNSGNSEHYPEIFFEGVPGMYEGGEIFGGETMEGSLIFLAPEVDEGLIFKYEGLIGQEVYLALQ